MLYAYVDGRYAFFVVAQNPRCIKRGQFGKSEGRKKHTNERIIKGELCIVTILNDGKN